LSTVHQPLFATGVRAADLLVSAIEGRRTLMPDGLEPISVVARRTT
jgi:DNA-binding LacI/PurR family transcriptional regulator